MASLMRESHPLTLKVMRLSRPSLAATQMVVPRDEASSVLATAAADVEQSHPTRTGTIYSDQQLPDPEHPLECFPVSETLVLPRSIGAMYLGETFAAHLCLGNDSTSLVRDIDIQVVMQTATQQLPLYSDSSQKQLPPGQPHNVQVSHEIKEQGAHILGCTLKYLSAQGDRRTLQKSFKFQVANPLIVKTKVNHLRRDVLLEVQVHNAMQASVALERMRFEASDPFVAQDLNLNITGDGQSVWTSKAGFMQPGDVRQYLYRLRPRHDSSAGSVEQDRAVQYAAALGRLDILWRGTFGSSGRLQTSQLLRKSPGMFLIEVVDAEIQNTSVAVEEPFTARVRIRNVSENKMSITAAAHANQQSTVIVCGPSHHNLGAFGVGETRDLELDFLPLAPGVQRVGPLVLTDTISGYVREASQLADAFVVSN